MIIKNGTRVLRPSEFKKLLSAIPSKKNQLIVQAMLYSGMRFVELKRLMNNPNWLMSSGFVYLPKEASRKARRKQVERWVRLNKKGYRVIRQLLRSKYRLATRQSYNEMLKLWAKKAGIGATGMCVKTFRKTLESWLVSAYPERILEITLSQGHNELTSVRHYLNMPFDENDKKSILKFLNKWI
ncbi:MAG: site-specific integrase [bacterium]